jgi:hypothetical protein
LSGKTALERNKDSTDYLALLNFYDKYPKEKRLLIYYEDLILKFEEQMKKVISFLKIENTLEDFMSKFDDHKTKSLNTYAKNMQSPVTQGSKDKLIFHSNKIPKEKRIELDTYIKTNFKTLYEKYLKRYTEK